MRIFVAGDTHANTSFLCDYLYPQAANVGATAIVQLGDFGYWEHESLGVSFLDAVAAEAKRFDIPLYFLHGNHDKWSLLMQKYGDKRTVDGFIRVRPRVNFIPQGYAWTWAGTRFRAFGGAYSIDKKIRLGYEAQRYRQAWEREMHRRMVGLEHHDLPSTAGTLWFPEEQMTDDEFAALMAADSGPKDIIFSHDKPRSTDCGLPLKDEPECWPNQDRLQRALLTHQPKLWMHGHLHHHYTHHVRNGDEGGWTEVVGLAPDTQAAGRFYKPTQAWAVLDVRKDQPLELTFGNRAEELDGSSTKAIGK